MKNAVVSKHECLCAIKGCKTVRSGSFLPLKFAVLDWAACCWRMRGEHLFIFTLPDSNLGFVQIQQGNYVIAQCFVFLTFPVKSYHRGPVPFSSQTASKACSVLHSLHFRMCTNRWCCRSAESDSAGMELQNTSWLGRRTAVCADSTTLSSWQRDKLSSAFLLATPSLSACVDELRRVNYISSSPYRLLCPLSFSLTFSLDSRLLSWR